MIKMEDQFSELLAKMRLLHDDLRVIQTELCALHTLVEQRLFAKAALQPQPNDLVDAHYVAARFGCSTRSVQRGGCNTGNIPRISRDPLRFRRADVDAELKRLYEVNVLRKKETRRTLIRRRKSY